jgi:hypothetical protein
MELSKLACSCFSFECVPNSNRIVIRNQEGALTYFRPDHVCTKQAMSLRRAMRQELFMPVAVGYDVAPTPLSVPRESLVDSTMDILRALIQMESRKPIVINPPHLRGERMWVKHSPGDFILPSYGDDNEEEESVAKLLEKYRETRQSHTI